MQPFSIPVQITLQGSRRCHGRAALSPSERKRDTEQHAGGSQDVHTKLPSSAGEDRAMLLGFAMMGFSVLMFFLFGKPFMLSTQREESNCTMVQTHVLEEQVQCAFTCGADCRAQGTDLCLQVFVNLTHSGQKVLLYYNEEAIQINSKSDDTDCKVREKQTLTVFDEHRQEVQSQAKLLARTARMGRGLKFSDMIILYSQYSNTCILLCQILIWAIKRT
ncbi:calcium-activated potassium channel subunit beta-3 isoform X4 [Erinaceus europaeus]|uniref:Calcium-activated potassium channel subunit beta n=1 Tax=Erinaceus europaeus TaxID=9365 RepID=A0A1S3W4Z3_ERIEU|nr:calcium-activated potassium channel subunit beta-3 isoform X4 [Erinaceus europaeus]